MRLYFRTGFWKWVSVDTFFKHLLSAGNKSLMLWAPIQYSDQDTHIDIQTTRKNVWKRYMRSECQGYTKVCRCSSETSRNRAVSLRMKELNLEERHFEMNATLLH